MTFRLRPAEGWITIGLLAIMFLSIAWSMQAADWAEGMYILQPVVLVALLAGLVLAKLRWLPGPLAHWLAMALGLSLVVYLTIHTPYFSPDLRWQVRLIQLRERFIDWYRVATGQGSSYDNAIFIMQMGLLVWLVSYLSAWFLFRGKQVWWAVVPTGLTMLINIYYYNEGPVNMYPYALLFAVAALLMVVRATLFIQEEDWRSRGIGFTPEIAFDYLRDGIIVSSVVLVIALFTPRTSAFAEQLYTAWARVEGPWTDAQAQWGRLFSSINYKPRRGPAYFGKTMTLAGPVNLGDEVVMQVRAPTGMQYLRGALYDEYTGRGWINTDVNFRDIDINRTLIEPTLYKNTVEVTQTIRFMRTYGENLIYAEPQVLRVGVPARAQLSTALIPQENAQINLLDISMMRGKQPLKDGEDYSVVSLKSDASTVALRKATLNYPDYILKRYTQLPAAVPQRVKDLALQISKDKNTVIDKLFALEGYLRGIQYNENVPAPPVGRDAVDYFLFDSKQGYCDYYASSFVVLARSLGLPARVSAGYSHGQYDDANQIYNIREYDAHSWPEAYLPEFGWVQFEPTAAFPGVARPQPDITDLTGNSTNPDDLLDELERLKDRETALNNSYIPPDEGLLGAVKDFAASMFTPERLTYGGILFGIPLLMLGAVLFVWRTSLRGLTVVEAFYERVARLGRLLGIKLNAHDTPHEYARRIGDIVPPVKQDVFQIVDNFVTERFAPRKPSADAQTSKILNESWRRARLTLFRAGVGRRLRFLAARLPFRLSDRQPKDKN
ncbi:MAG: DUF4129 domain-containing protein [Chloroflexi bacterium]|nr:DUF4129 domain-containing protein [Chloroflexota bacterium]